MSWKNVQYENGKYRTSEGGGGGSSTFASLDDVNFDNIQNGQVPKYNSTTQKWENANESGGGGTITDVKVDGVSVVNQQGVAEIPAIPTVNVDDVKVNGTSVVDANGVAQIISYEEVTQAEYDALPSSKTSNGVAYFIKDGGTADGIKVFSLGDIYDTEEHEIGVWTDGKPLYQKTIILHESDLSKENNWHWWKSYMSGIQNVDKKVNVFGTMQIVWDGTTYKSPLFTKLYKENSTTDTYIETADYYSSFSIKSHPYNTSAYSKLTNVTINWIAINVQYTKTTDVAGSGTLAQGGVPAHHYSTSEQVIGTWINGKPIYEKTFDCGLVAKDTSWHDIQHNISNIANVIKVDGIFTNSNETYPIPNIRPTQTTGCCIYRLGNYIRYMNNWLEANTFTLYVTLQYTKTTD